MKQIKNIIVAIIATLALIPVSCNKIESIRRTSLTVKATYPSDDVTDGVTTKTYRNQGETWWNSKDKISIISSDGKCVEVFTGSNTSAAATADFTCSTWQAGRVPAWAVFGYDEEQSSVYSPSLVDGKIHALLSSYQVFANDNSFSSRSNLAIGQIVESESDYTTSMKNICGMLQIKIKTDYADIASIKLEDADNTAAIAGEVLVDYNAGEPTYSVVPDTQKSAVTCVFSTKNRSTFAANKFYWIAVLPGAQFTPKFTFTKTDGSTAVIVANKSITVGRNKLVDLGAPLLNFIPAGSRNVVSTITFAEWPFNESISGAVKAATTYTDKENGFSFKFVPSSAGSFSYSAANSRVQFNNSNDGTEYIEIVSPANAEITSVSITMSNSSKVPLAIKDLSDAVIETVTGLEISSSNEMIKNGCRLCLTKAKQQYNISKISVNYLVSSAD